MHMARTKLAFIAAAVAVLALAAAGPVGAYTTKEKAAERKQNTRIKTALKGVNAQTLVNNTQTQSLVDIRTLAEGIDARLKVIEGAAPQIVDGLNQLKDAATQLKTGLETAGAGLNSLKTLSTSTEYGFGQMLVFSPAPNPQAGSFVVTPDIPDAVQQAQTTQQFVAQHSGNLGALFGVRSAESDGTGSSNPAAHCKVTVTNEAGATETTAANPGLGGLPFQPVDVKSAQTSTDPANAGFPFGLKTSGSDADSTVTFVSSIPVTAGDTYTAGLSCVDTSASSSDPSA